MSPRRRGFTLVEVMIVVAIIGVMAALAAVGVQSMNRFGRVNGATDALAQLMTSLRSRAMTEHCRYMLQINGPDYDAASAPADVPRMPNTALVYRKGDCASTVPAFEPGLAAPGADRLVSQYPLGEYRVELELPAAVLPGSRLLTQSLTLSWNALGQRQIAIDADADGTSDAIAVAGELMMVVRASPGSDTTLPSQALVVPAAGRARAP